MGLDDMNMWTKYGLMCRTSSANGELAQLVERSLCMRKVVDSISAFSRVHK